MRHATPSPRPRQVEQLREQLHYTAELPFAQLLDRDTIRQALRDEAVSFRDRLFSPFVTLWVFLSQVLDADQCCRAAVALLRLACRPATAARFTGPQRLLQGARPPPRGRPEPADTRDRPPRPGPRFGGLAVEWPPAQGRRWHDRLDAGHARQPAGIPPAQLPETGSGLPHRAHGRAVLADRRHGPRRRPGTLLRQTDG